jgi:mRNA interferase MazF
VCNEAEPIQPSKDLPANLARKTALACASPHLGFPTSRSPEFQAKLNKQLEAINASKTHRDADGRLDPKKEADRPRVLRLRRVDRSPTAGPGDYTTSPRPLWSFSRSAGTESVLLCPVTSELDIVPGLYRIPVLPSTMNGLTKPSCILVEKIMAARRAKCGKLVGRLEPDTMEEVDAALLFVIGLAD